MYRDHEVVMIFVHRLILKLNDSLGIHGYMVTWITSFPPVFLYL